MTIRFMLIMLFLLSGMLVAQSAESSLQVRFFDSATGIAVQPAALQVRNSDADVEWQPQQSASPVFRREMKPGNYRLFAIAEGYLPMETEVAVETDKEARYDLYLQSRIEHSLLSIDHMRNLQRNDAMLICGFISDSDGRPIAGANVLTNDQAEVRTDQNGYFVTWISTSLPTGEITFAKEGYRSEYRRNIELWPGGDWIYRIRLEAGSGLSEIDEDRETRIRAQMEAEECETCPQPETDIEKSLQDPVLLRTTIRVGRNCSGTLCTSTEVYTLQDYCKFVLPHEWYSCWGSLSNGMNSLRAGAVAIRTYATWHVYNPLNTTYDICDNTSCQFFGSSQSSNANNAVNMTERFVMINGSGNVPRSEYSAENNNAGCGDGYCGTGTTTAPCISDPVCTGQSTFGHGRGLCQYGTARWANGTVISRSSPCSSGPSHGQGTKTWQEMIEHYYPNYTLTQAANASLIDVTAVPAVAGPGQRIVLEYEIDAAPSINVLLDAEITETGTTNYIADQDDEDLVSLVPGYNLVSRNFDLPASLNFGFYDIRATLFYDRDNNGLINSGDFRFDRVLYPQALEIGAVGIDPAGSIVPQEHRLQQNYPNPFNPETTIEFELPAASVVTLEIYDINGRHVETLDRASLTAGNHQYIWNGTDAAGHQLSSGVYLYRLQATPLSGGETVTITRKLILSR